MTILALAAFWHALSPLGLLLGVGGLGILVVVAFGLVALPGWLSRPAIVAGGILLAIGAVHELGYAQATHAAEVRREREIAEANRLRAETAEAALAADRDRAAADAAITEPMKREIDATPRDSRPALPLAAVRRLRSIR